MASGIGVALSDRLARLKASAAASRAIALQPLRIKHIKAVSFKAFQNLDLPLEGKHLLAYGANGAGKSSLYWALHVFLQSANKSTTEVSKYFDANLSDSLVNLHVSAAAKGNAAITMALENAVTNAVASYTVSNSVHETANIPSIASGNLASDFITYRVLFNFYNFRNSQAIDLWPVFEQEILPFCRGNTGANISQLWRTIQEAKPYESHKVWGESSSQYSKRIERIDSQLRQLNTELGGILARITQEAQQFYDLHFSKEDVARLEFGVNLSTPASYYDRKLRKFDAPVIGFGLKINDLVIQKPQSFLNEAKLTQLALSVRFGATLSYLQESPIKLLVLDDLLISLDMNNRIKVVDIILSDTFKDYQKIILTHDIGFFKEFRRRIGQKHTEWSFQRFVGTSATNVRLEVEQSDIEKAHAYVNLQKLDEAANCMRKAAEDAARRLRENYAQSPIKAGEFQSISKNLKIAKSKLQSQIPHQLYDRLNNAATNGLINQQVMDGLKTLIAPEEWLAFDCIIEADGVLLATERVLNPGSHAGEAPLYEGEVVQTLALVERFLLKVDALIHASSTVAQVN